MTSFYGSVNGGQGGGGGEGIDTSTLLQKNDPTFNGTITGPNAHFTGTVQIPEPTEDNHAATKAYVDAALADVDLSEVTTRMDAIETAQDELAAQLDDKVDAENPAFTGTATLNGKNVATVDQIPNISDLPYLDENNPAYTGTLTGANATFSGVVSVPAPTQDGQAVNKQYVDQAIAGIQTEVDLSEIQADIAELQTGKLDKANPTYTGNLAGETAAFSGSVTVATPTAEGEAANKGYVDAAKMELAGDINTLQQTVASQTETINTLNQQITNITSGTTELPYLKNTGDSGTGVYDFTGATINAADPVDNSNVATKHYVDQKVASAGGAGEVVSYTQGDGISISPENEISLSIDSAGANGLKVGTNGLGLDLATSATPGAMAASDKTAIASNTTEITNIKNGTTELPYVKNTGGTINGTLTVQDEHGSFVLESAVLTLTAKKGETTNTVLIGYGTSPEKVSISDTERYVTLSGADPEYPDNFATKRYVDQAVENAKDTELTETVKGIVNGTTELPYLKETNPTYEGTLIGVDATFTGSVQISTPDQDNEAANKSYVDTALAEAKSYTDDAVSGIASDETIQQIQTDIENIENGTTELPYIKNNGDIVTGNYNLTGAAVTIAAPAADNNPATKKYVDDSISAIDVSTQIAPVTERVTTAEGEIDALQTEVNNVKNGTTELPYIKDNGDTVNGDYTFNGKVNVNKPTENSNVTNKEYVDNTYNDISTLRNLYADGEIIIFTEEGKPLNLKLYGYSWFNGVNSYCNISKKEGETFQLAFHTGDEDKYIQLPDSLVLNGIDTRYMSDYDDQENAILNYKPIYFSADSNGEELDNFEIIADEYDFSTGKYIKKIGVIDSYNGEDLSKTVYTTYSIQNHTSEIAQTGETVFYLLNEPVETDIPQEIMGAYNQLQFHKGNTSLQLQGMMYSSIDFIYTPIEITFKIDKTNPCNNHFSANRYDESNTTYIYGNPDAVFMMPDIYAENATIHDFFVEDDIYIYHNSRLSDYRYRIEGKSSDRGLKFTIQDDGGRDDLITLEIADPVYDNQAATKGYVDEAIEAIDAGNEIDTLQTEVSNIKDGTLELPYVKKSGDTMAGLLTLNQGLKNVNVFDPSYETNLSSNILSFKHGSIVQMLGLQGNKLKFTDSGAQNLVRVEVDTPVETNDAANKKYVDETINKFYHVQVLTATSKDQVDNLFASWWKTKWIEGVTTYNSMLEDWFANVLYDDRVHGVKLPLWETSHSQYGEFTDDSIGLTCEVSTEDYAGQDDFAYLPQFWCVEVAVEKNADYTHTFYACEFIDDINVVRAGGPNDGKHLVWVLQKNTYRREWEEEGYKYIKTRCTPAEGYTTWLQGTDNRGRVYPYVGIPKYAAGIESDGTIGSRAGLKPAIFESYDSGIQKWRARGSQYTGGSYLTLKWQLDMIALKYASKGNSNGIEGCVSFNIQTPVLVAESNANRVIINQDQANNFMVGQYINIGSGDRLVSETNVLITNIETVNISETDYLALTFEGNPIETTTAQKVCSLPWTADITTNLIKGNDGQAIKGQTVTGLIQKTEFLNGTYLITSDEKWKWDAASNHEDGSRTFECYICEDASNITTGNSLENYTLTASINLPAEYNNTNKYITDIVTTDKQIVFPKAVSNEAGSTTGYCDCMLTVVWALLDLLNKKLSYFNNTKIIFNI